MRLKIKLARNLRRSILRGHPWVYREALQAAPKLDRAQLAQVLDTKGELAWAIYDPHGPLSLRILSLLKGPPSQDYFAGLLKSALELRSSLITEKTTAYRLFNGEGDRLPGLVCDVYGDIAVLQFDGRGPGEFWDKAWLAEWLLANTKCKTVLEKSRRSENRSCEKLAGEDASTDVIIQENGVRFHVNLDKGQKTGFFLDQRDNREFVRTISRGRSTLNLFSYTGGFSVYAGLGGAPSVASLDVAAGAIDLAEKNWALNGLAPAQHKSLCVDVFEYLQSPGEAWDHILVDPPSMSHSEDKKDTALTKYIDLFAASAKRVKPGGRLSLSSCSSHVSFDDFFEIITESLSQARRRGRILRVSGQGPDHPFPHACPELRYLKFVHLALD